MKDPRIEVFDTGIHITDLEVPKKEAAEYLRAVPEDERELALVRAIEVGVFCLERARTGQDLDFVRRQIDSLLTTVQSTVEKIPEHTQEQLAAKIGTGEGQVLAPVQLLVNDVSKAASEKIREVRSLLDQEIDPSKETSTMGRVLRTVRDLLDPKRTDSVQGSINAAIQQVTGEAGPLAKAVREVVATTVKPLTEQMDLLAKEIRGREAAAEALAQTTEKGETYEEAVLLRLRSWAEPVGAQVTHVGPDNRPGDVLVSLNQFSVAETAVTIIVEARDRERGFGRKAISDLLSRAMVERAARAAVYVSQSPDGLAKEIGEWAEGACDQGPFVACTDEHLLTAVRFLIAQEKLTEAKAQSASIDVSSVAAQLQRIRTTLRRITAINTKITEVKGGVDAIQEEANALRDEIRDSLVQAEDALRISSSPADEPESSASAG